MQPPPSMMPVTPTIELRKLGVGGGHIEVGEGHGKTIFALPKSEKYEAAENVKGCVGKAARHEFLAPFWCVTTVRPKEECNMEVMVKTRNLDGQGVHVSACVMCSLPQTGAIRLREPKIPCVVNSAPNIFRGGVVLADQFTPHP